MPEDKEPKTVDIDTSGPGADVELPEEKINFCKNSKRSKFKN